MSVICDIKSIPDLEGPISTPLRQLDLQLSLINSLNVANMHEVSVTPKVPTDTANS